jgi:hypothetical protein
MPGASLAYELARETNAVVSATGALYPPRLTKIAKNPARLPQKT